MTVLTDQGVLDGIEIQYVHRDRDGVFHFNSKATLELNEVRLSNWNAVLAKHAYISDFGDRPNGWSAIRTASGWEETTPTQD